jgi:hypothetical protein
MPECNPNLTNENFICTGADFSEVWNHIHKEIVPQMKRDCYNCGSHAELLFKGVHDHVSIGIGKTPVYPKLYEAFVKEVNSVHNSLQNRFEGFK